MFIYFIRNTRTGAIKIGLSENPQSRLSELQVGNEDLLTIETMLPGGIDLEDELHLRYSRLRLRGEWFSSAPELESFIRCTKYSNNISGFDSDIESIGNSWFIVWLLQHNVLRNDILHLGYITNICKSAQRDSDPHFKGLQSLCSAD